MKPALLATALLAVPTAVAARPAPGGYQPYCAAPGTRALFLSPMGEPFRAAPGQPYPSAVWFAAADRDRDGTVDRVEFIRDADRFFRTLDTDHDGRLTPAEIDRYEREIAPEVSIYGPRGQSFDPPRQGRLRGGESGYGGPMGAGRYAWLNIPQPVAAADLDVSRVVDEKEFAGAAGRRFEQLAPNGTLRLADLPKTPQQAALEGPCQKRPKPRGKRSGDHDERRDDERDGGAPDGSRRNGADRP